METTQPRNGKRNGSHNGSDATQSHNGSHGAMSDATFKARYEAMKSQPVAVREKPLSRAEMAPLLKIGAEDRAVAEETMEMFRRNEHVLGFTTLTAEMFATLVARCRTIEPT